MQKKKIVNFNKDHRFIHFVDNSLNSLTLTFDGKIRVNWLWLWNSRCCFDFLESYRLQPTSTRNGIKWTWNLFAHSLNWYSRECRKISAFAYEVHTVLVSQSKKIPIQPLLFCHFSSPQNMHIAYWTYSRMCLTDILFPSDMPIRHFDGAFFLEKWKKKKGTDQIQVLWGKP